MDDEVNISPVPPLNPANMMPFLVRAVKYNVSHWRINEVKLARRANYTSLLLRYARGGGLDVDITRNEDGDVFMSRAVNIFTTNIRRMNIRQLIAGYNRTLDQSIPVDINSPAGIEIVIRMISRARINFDAKFRAIWLFRVQHGLIVVISNILFEITLEQVNIAFYHHLADRINIE